MEVEEAGLYSAVGSAPVGQSSQSSRKRSRIDALEQKLDKIHVSKGKEPLISCRGSSKYRRRMPATAAGPPTLRLKPPIIPDDDPLYDSDLDLEVESPSSSTTADDDDGSSKRRRRLGCYSYSSQPPVAAAGPESNIIVHGSRGSFAPPDVVIDLTAPNPIPISSTSGPIPSSSDTPILHQQQIRRSPRQSNKPSLRFSSSSCRNSGSSSSHSELENDDDLLIQGRALGPRASSNTRHQNGISDRQTVRPRRRKDLPINAAFETMHIDDRDDLSATIAEPTRQEISDAQIAHQLQEQEYAAWQPLDPGEFEASARLMLLQQGPRMPCQHGMNTRSSLVTSSSAGSVVINSRPNNHRQRQSRLVQTRLIHRTPGAAQNRNLYHQHDDGFDNQDYNLLLGDMMGRYGVAAHPGNYAEIDDDYESLIRLSERIGDVKSKGTPKHILQQLPTRRYKAGSSKGDDSKCSVCLTEYDAGEEIKTLPCGHQYHVECVDSWLSKNGACPVCRLNVQEAVADKSIWT
ncbi:hypothetical protein SeMB42_g03383 [Synchytrium endobioticum]|uniref:RING-type E3 ubiquitin transferase n=1 Tax=Synchytrium endobioticum TaxID=286115 RepID=A0A507D793_9FUNG|nr:hypothetical protein SeMB42_g03383 [Synchytrium endobioticum]